MTSGWEHSLLKGCFGESDSNSLLLCLEEVLSINDVHNDDDLA